MTSKIVHDNDVAGLQLGDELLLAMSAKALVVDWSVEDARCCELIPALRTEEGQRAPVAMCSKGVLPLAPRAPIAQTRPVGLDPVLIDGDQSLRIWIDLLGSPSLALRAISARAGSRANRVF